MSQPIFDSLRQVTPSVAPGADGLPRVAPQSVDEMAHVMGLAAREHWRVRIEGRGTWVPPDAPADLAVTTSALDRIVSVSPADLVARAQAGVTAGPLARALAGHRAWLALDPPGHPERSLGSVLATATQGPLRHGAGPVRDHVLGVTVVTGDGRVVRAGGQVVKNVAGYDLAKLAVGGFGAFGIVAEANLRLRAEPERRITLVVRGDLDPLIDAGSAIAAGNPVLAALELVSPGLAGVPDWLLLVKAAGTDAALAATQAQLASAAPGLEWQRMDPGPSEIVERALAGGAADAPVTPRLGVLAPGIPDVLDLLDNGLGLTRVSAGLGAGGIRWTGDPDVVAVRALRGALAEREIPVTLERGPWAVRSAVGHFGAYREGVGPLTTRLRQVFDPEGCFVVALEEEARG
jgi:FAD/FMN-containing dehydrogenase